MQIRVFLFAVLISFSSLQTTAQALVRDSAILIPFFGVGGEFHLPGGDMKERFGADYGVQSVLVLRHQRIFFIVFKVDFFSAIKSINPDYLQVLHLVMEQ